MLKISELNHVIVFFEPSSLPDGYGGFEVKLNPIFTAWAKIETLKPTVSSRGLGKSKPWTHLMTMRNDARLSTAVRVVHNNHLFAIDQIFECEKQNNLTELYLIDRGIYESNS